MDLLSDLNPQKYNSVLCLFKEIYNFIHIFIKYSFRCCFRIFQNCLCWQFYFIYFKAKQHQTICSSDNCQYFHKKKQGKYYSKPFLLIQIFPLPLLFFDYHLKSIWKKYKFYYSKDKNIKTKYPQTRFQLILCSFRYLLCGIFL